MRRNYKKGQALVEVAVFGAVLLFCFGIVIRYGLMMNYQQRAQMEAFRRALLKAYEGTDNYLQSTYLVVKDKNIPDPGNLFALGERSPFAASASVTMTNDLFAVQEGTEQDAPRVFYNINGKPYVFKTAKANVVTPVEHNGDDIHDPGEIWVKVKNPAFNPLGPDKKKFSWVDLPSTWPGYNYGTLQATPDDDGYTWSDAYDVDDDGEKDSISVADIDGDDKEEKIILIFGSCETTDMNIQTACSISAIKVWDYQDADMDFTKEKELEKQGLKLDGYKKTLINKSSLTNTEDKSQIANERNIDFTETIKREIKVNSQAGGQIDMDYDNDDIPEEIIPMGWGGGALYNETTFKNSECFGSSGTWTTQK